MAFGQDFLNAFFGNDYLRDYNHAAKTFQTNGYENSPRFKFLYHVYFNLNTTAIPLLSNVLNTQEQSTIGILVKSIDLPSFKMDVEVQNQYNRKRLIQKKIEYNPVKAIFHDDNGDLIRTLWYNYYSYYYKDPSQQYNSASPTNGTSGNSQTQATGFSYNNRDIYDETRTVNDWGYIGESYSDGPVVDGGKPPFFRDINIYGFNGTTHKFVQYVLVNPMISEWSHDTYDYSQDEGIMENTLTINYETVKYYTGAIGNARSNGGATFVQGFANPTYYDTRPSPLSRPGGTGSILGQGGLLDAGLGIYQDLQSGSVAGIIGAVQTAGRAYNTVNRPDFTQGVIQEIRDGITGTLRNNIPGQVRSQPNGPTGNGARPTVSSAITGAITGVQQAMQAPVFNIPSFNPSAGRALNYKSR